MVSLQGLMVNVMIVFFSQVPANTMKMPPREEFITTPPDEILYEKRPTKKSVEKKVSAVDGKKRKRSASQSQQSGYKKLKPVVPKVEAAASNNCTVCHLQFSDKQFQRHNSLDHHIPCNGNAPDCLLRFTSNKDRNDHVKMCHKIAVHCHECNKELTQQEWDVHACLSEKNNKHPSLHSTALQNDTLKTEISVKSKSRVTSPASPLLERRKSWTPPLNDDYWICENCSEPLESEAKYNSHKQKPHPHQCPECPDKAFQTLSSLFKHQFLCHDKKSAKICEDCGEPVDPKSFASHKRRPHNVQCKYPNCGVSSCGEHADWVHKITKHKYGKLRNPPTQDLISNADNVTEVAISSPATHVPIKIESKPEKNYDEVDSNHLSNSVPDPELRDLSQEETPEDIRAELMKSIVGGETENAPNSLDSDTLPFSHTSIIPEEEPTHQIFTRDQSSTLIEKSDLSVTKDVYISNFEQCCQCQVLISQAKFKSHQKKKHDFRCEVSDCNLAFITEIELDKHRFQDHRDRVDGDKYLVCGKCGYFFCANKEKSRYDNHMKNGKHNECPKCERVFDNFTPGLYEHHVQSCQRHLVEGVSKLTDFAQQISIKSEVKIEKDEPNELPENSVAVDPTVPEIDNEVGSVLELPGPADFYGDMEIEGGCHGNGGSTNADISEDVLTDDIKPDQPEILSSIPPEESTNNLQNDNVEDHMVTNYDMEDISLDPPQALESSHETLTMDAPKAVAESFENLMNEHKAYLRAKQEMKPMKFCFNAGKITVDSSSGNERKSIKNLKKRKRRVKESWEEIATPPKEEDKSNRSAQVEKGSKPLEEGCSSSMEHPEQTPVREQCSESPAGPSSATLTQHGRPGRKKHKGRQISPESEAVKMEMEKIKIEADETEHFMETEENDYCVGQEVSEVEEELNVKLNKSNLIHLFDEDESEEQLKDENEEPHNISPKNNDRDKTMGYTGQVEVQEEGMFSAKGEDNETIEAIRSLVNSPMEPENTHPAEKESPLMKSLFDIDDEKSREEEEVEQSLEALSNFVHSQEVNLVNNDEEDKKGHLNRTIELFDEEEDDERGKYSPGPDENNEDSEEEDLTGMSGEETTANQPPPDASGNIHDDIDDLLGDSDEEEDNSKKHKAAQPLVVMPRESSKKKPPRFECPECGLKFGKDEAKYSHHIKMDHPFKCNFCPLKFTYKNGLQDHQNKEHMFEMRKFQSCFRCTKCDSTFTRDSALERHKNQEHKFPCDYCDLVFINDHEVESHMLQCHPQISRGKKETPKERGDKSTEKKRTDTEWDSKSRRKPESSSEKETKAKKDLRKEKVGKSHLSESSAFMDALNIVSTVKKIPKKFKSSKKEYQEPTFSEDDTRCEQCGQLFVETEVFQAHIEQEHAHQCYEAGCGASFTHEYYLRLHQSQAHQMGDPPDPAEKPADTPHADADFPGPSESPEDVSIADSSYNFSLTNDLSSTFNDTVYSVSTFDCDECSVSCNTKQELEDHRALHYTPEPPEISSHYEQKPSFPCTFPNCKQSFETGEKLRRHYTRAHERQHKCQLCRKQFPSEGKLRHHRTLDHRHKCQHCSRAYLLKPDLLHHVLKAHDRITSEEAMGFTCKQCEERFPDLQTFKTHESVPHVHACHLLECPRSFPERRQLETHLTREHQVLHVNIDTSGECGARGIITTQRSQANVDMADWAEQWIR